MTKPSSSTKTSVLRPTKLFLGLYFLLIASLFLYSFTQVDLGLTMTRANVITEIQRAFQSIGYFNRPLSAGIYSGLVVLLFIFYGMYLSFAKRQIISNKTVWITVLALAGILTLSYTAFSHDIFNYIFDAKIITQYNENPYFKKALDYPHDPMLAFMHWTHRTYPYGPTWLLATVPLSFVGLQYFLPTYFLFKILAGVFYLIAVFGISRIMKIVAPKYETFAMVFFALNPLVIIESLVSGHNDIVMMALCVISILFLVQKRFILSFVFLFLSIGIKYATGFLLPLYLAIVLFQRRKITIPWENIFLIFVVALLFAAGAAILRTNFQPWYLLFVLPVAALVANRSYILIPSIILTIAALINYLPYLYLGNWDEPVPTILQRINISALVLSGIVTGVYVFLQRKKAH